MSREETEIMDVETEDELGNMGPDASKSLIHRDDLNTQPEANGSTVHHTEPEEASGADRVGQEDSELSLTDDVSGFESSCLIPPHTSTPTLGLEAPVDQKLAFGFRDVQSCRTAEAYDALPVCTQLPVSKDLPSHSSTLQAQKFHDQHGVRQASTSTTSHSLKRPAAQSQHVTGDDLCASLVLACLFCRLWDCLLAAGEGCHVCLSSVCSSVCSTLCCCHPSLLFDWTPHCDGSGCLEAYGCLCGGPNFNCPICEVCLQATECLDLGMEISQLLFH